MVKGASHSLISHNVCMLSWNTTIRNNLIWIVNELCDMPAWDLLSPLAEAVSQNDPERPQIIRIHAGNNVIYWHKTPYRRQAKPWFSSKGHRLTGMSDWASLRLAPDRAQAWGPSSTKNKFTRFQGWFWTLLIASLKTSGFPYIDRHQDADFCFSGTVFSNI